MNADSSHLDDLNLRVEFTRSFRAKYLRLTLKPDRTITVTVPRFTPLEEAKRFLHSKSGWIRKTLNKMDSPRPAAPTADLKGIDLEQAQTDLFERLRHFSRMHSLPYRGAAFRCQKTKWASCSGRNHISLNINIALLPRHLQDYILLHELAHIREKIHSDRFWALLDQLCGGKARAFARELKPYPLTIRV